MTNKSIYLLIGQKGSGKSFIGTLMEKEFGIKFLWVEYLAKQIKREREIDDESYIIEYFQTVEREVRTILESYDRIVFESTGLTAYFDQMLENLRNDFLVITIGVKASDELCLQRTKTRDKTNHINVSDDQVNQINQQVRKKLLLTDFNLVNENKTKEQLISEIKQLI